jgi:hypothetical protein
MTSEVHDLSWSNWLDLTRPRLAGFDLFPEGVRDEVGLAHALEVLAGGEVGAPSICAVISWSQPTTRAMRVSARRLRCLRVSAVVSKTISRSSVTAKPITAAWGLHPARSTPARPACGAGGRR